jgi:alkylation response protein AidB-like acyl-CoA dehydrogenase
VAEEGVLRGEGIEAWSFERALVGCAATQVGVCERALEITTGYLKEREQFGAPLGALPPVQHRCADAYIALDALRWVTWQAAWRLAEGVPAWREARVAKFWAADAGSRITTATQHLHGGMGVDLDYPIHRYFLWAKALELAYGGATAQLVALGDDMARTGPQERA